MSGVIKEDSLVPTGAPAHMALFGDSHISDSIKQFSM